jgi:tetratricopeptide (TPR) repeat protein
MGSGNTAYALGDLAASEAAFKQAVGAHPEASAAHNNLAHVLAERGKIPEALAAARRAVSLGGPLLSSARATLEEIQKKAAAGGQ